MAVFTRVTLLLALLLQARGEWQEIDQNHYRKPARVYFNDTSVNPHWGKGNVIKLAAGIGRVEHVTKPGAVQHSETVTSGYNAGRIADEDSPPRGPQKETSREKERERPRRPQYGFTFERSRSSTRAPNIAIVRRPDDPKRHITGDVEDHATRKTTNRPKYITSRPSEVVTENTERENVRREDNTRNPAVYTISSPNRATRIPNRIYINGNRASTSKIPSDDEYFVTEKPTSTVESVKQTTAQRETNRRKDTYVNRNPFGHINYEEDRPSNRYEETDIQLSDLRKPAEDLKSDASIINDKAPIDLEKLDIRRIDIATLAEPETPDFITKQDFLDDDEGQPLYIEYEESSTPGIPQINPFSSSANEEFASEATDMNESVHNEEEYKQDHEDGSNEDVSAHKTNDKLDDTLTDEKKQNPIENVVKFMKVVSETISKNTHRGIDSKMRYLEDLRDTIMMNIGM